MSNTIGTDPRFAMKSLGLLLEGVEDLDVAACGVLMVVRGRQTDLTVIDCARVVVDGLEVGWVVSTVIDVTVPDTGIDADGAWRRLAVPAYPWFPRKPRGQSRHCGRPIK